MRQNFNELFSKMPPQAQERVSTLRSYIEALGGQLEGSARFDGTLIRLDQFASIEADPVSENALSETHRIHD